MLKSKTLAVLFLVSAMVFSSVFVNVSNASSLFSVSAQGNDSVQVGVKTSYSVAVSDTGNATGDAIVDVEVHDTSGAKVYQQFFANQNFSGGQTQSYNVSWTPSSAGTYTIETGVFTPNWSSLLYWGNQETVQASNPVPVFSVTGTSASSVEQGKTISFGENVKDSGDPISKVIIDVEVENASGAQVHQQFFTGQNFGAGQTQSYNVSWTPGATMAPGNYSVNVGVFSEYWSNLLLWKNAGNFSVGSAVNFTSGNPSKFYVDPTSSALTQAAIWQSSDPANAARMSLIANQPQATWFGGWNANITADVNALVSAAQSSSTMPVLVAYNIPDRDCGGYSAGGAETPAAYQSWINAFAAGIGNRPATVILEPDALASMDCLSAADQTTRLHLLTYAVQTLKSLGQTKVYIDAGNSNWVSAITMAMRLEQADIAEADGFSLNISNFYTTASNTQYGTALSALVGGKHFVIDTSRNGAGSDNGEWCNPPGMALGALPTTNTGNGLTDALLWIKPPGESDGTCNGGPSAGAWWPQYAAGLAQTAGY